MKIFNCIECSTQWNSKTALDNHRREVHQMSVIVMFQGRSKQIHRNENKLFRCPFCSKQFKSSTSIRRHGKICNFVNDEKLISNSTLLAFIFLDHQNIELPSTETPDETFELTADLHGISLNLFILF